MMAIIVEDGTIIGGANSFVSLDDYVNYAESLGVFITDEDAAEIELIKAAQYINSKEPQLKGYLVDRDQPMSFPRTNLTIDGFGWGDTEIPRQVILCQLNLALDIRAGIDPYNLPVNPNRAVKREKVDVIEVEYVGGDSQAKLSRSSHWQALLSSLLRRNGLSIPLVRA
jgi:hypothetical protein